MIKTIIKYFLLIISSILSVVGLFLVVYDIWWLFTHNHRGGYIGASLGIGSAVVGIIVGIVILIINTFFLMYLKKHTK